MNDGGPAQRAVRRLTAYEIPISLKRPVRHASHTRVSTDSIFVRCELTDGTVGWGEGLPRTYVTGDSIATAWRHLEATDFSPILSAFVSNVQEAVDAIQRVRIGGVLPDPGIQARECFGNSVRCAIEIAYLDAFCRSFGQPFGAVAECVPEAGPLLEKANEVFYSGVVTAQSGFPLFRSALKMRLFGFRSVKVKVGTRGIDDRHILSTVRRVCGRSVNLRLDANEAWTCDEVVARVEPLLRLRPTSLEQPVPHAEVSGLANVRKQVQVPIMLDESLCSLEDAQRSVDGESCDLFNLRLSKCGGYIPCLKLAAFAGQHGLGWQLGCQVGETGILSAAGRHFACNVGGIRYLEGSYDRFLVQDRLTSEDITFGHGGKAPRLTNPGLGVTVDEEHVRRLAARSEIVATADT